MKHTKKLASLLLALVMMFALATTAFAASGTSADQATITINNASVKETYSAYKILDVESTGTYKVNDTWSEFVNSDGIKDVYLNIDSEDCVTWVENADAESFGTLAKEYAITNTIEAETSATAEKSTLTLEGLPLGYYMVTSSMGTTVSLVTANPDAEINEKNEAPTVTKQVQEDSKIGTDEEWGTKNDVDFGQVINYKVTITLYPGSTNVVLHDRVDIGLSPVYSSAKVTADGVTLEKDKDYTVDRGWGDQQLIFTQDYLDTITEETKVIVTYYATLEDDAEIGHCGQGNMAWLTYGDSGETPKVTTTTYTWGFNVLKYTLKDGEKIPLEGATFTLSYNSDGSDPLIFEDMGDNTYRLVSETTKSVYSDIVTEITTDETGKITFEGLDSGTYYLTEIEAPSGYQTPDKPVEIVIDSTNDHKGNVTADGVEADGNGNDSVKIKTVEILNGTIAPEMPSTGGIGTIIFYVVGTVLVLGAAVLLITKKRMTNVQ